MSILELAAQLKTSKRVVKRMIAQGRIPSEPVGDLAAQIRASLIRGEQLTVSQLMALLKDKNLLASLGKYRSEARNQIGELGPVARDAAPAAVVNALGAAVEGDPNAVALLMQWLKAVLPPRGIVRHHWVAVRLLIKNPLSERRTNATRVFKALEKVREHPEFQGWHGPRPVKKQNPTFYHRPLPPFDL